MKIVIAVLVALMASSSCGRTLTIDRYPSGPNEIPHDHSYDHSYDHKELDSSEDNSGKGKQLTSDELLYESIVAASPIYTAITSNLTIQTVLTDPLVQNVLSDPRVQRVLSNPIVQAVLRSPDIQGSAMGPFLAGFTTPPPANPTDLTTSTTQNTASNVPSRRPVNRPPRPSRPTAATANATPIQAILGAVLSGLDEILGVMQNQLVPRRNRVNRN